MAMPVAVLVYASDNDGAIVEPTQLTEPKCDDPQCPNPLTKYEKED